MQFIPDTHHRYHYAATEIVSYGPGQKYSNSDSCYVEVELRDGRKVRVDESSLTDLDESYVGFIPAAAGTAIFHEGEWNGEEHVSQTCVIGWALKQDGYPVPITADGPEDAMFRQMPVLMPDGRVHARGNSDGRVYDNADEFVADRRAERRAKIERDRRLAEEASHVSTTVPL